MYFGVKNKFVPSKNKFDLLYLLWPLHVENSGSVLDLVVLEENYKRPALIPPHGPHATIH